MRIALALNWVCCMTLTCVAAGQGVTGTVPPDFSEMRLREGKQAYAAGRFAEAATQLRIAGFGFLGRPNLLCESLVYGALAEASADHKAQAQIAVERLSDIERRFPSCGEARIDPAIRAQYESRFHHRLLAFPAPTPSGLPPAARPPAAPTPHPEG
jgi:hypothetical protein